MSDSGKSTASAASRVTVEGKNERGSDAGSTAGEGQLHHIVAAVRDWTETFFAACHSLAKFRVEKNRRLAIAIVGFEFIQVGLFIIDPVFQWDINFDGNVFWRWLRRVHLQNQPVVMGYTTWLGCFYALLGVSVVSLLLFTYIGRIARKGAADAETTVRVLGPLMCALVTTFYLSCLNMLMVALYCNWTIPDERRNYLLSFPDKTCTSVGHMIQGVLAIIGVPLWVFLGRLYTACYMTTSPLTTELLAKPDSRMAVRNFEMRTLMSLSFFTIAAGRQFKLLSLIFLGALFRNFLDATMEPMYYSRRMNLWHAGSCGALFFASLVLVVHVHNPPKWRARDTVCLWAGSPLFGVASALIAWRLFERDRRLGARFVAAAAEALAKDVHSPPATLAAAVEMEFESAEQVERVARALRDGPIQAESEPADYRARLVGSEVALLVGCRQYPDNKVLAIHLGNYRMFATFDVNGAASASEKARAGTTAGAVGHKPKEGHASGIVESCMLSWLLLEVRERSGTDSGGGESSMTLAQYVEFQDTFAYILHLHAAAAHADRRFWRMLVVKRLTFKQLAAALGHIESAQAKAFKEFKAAAEKYPKNVQLLRAYGHFMDAIKHDPDTAQRCFQEAEKLEAEAADDEGGGAGGVNDKRDAVVVISPTGIIRIANKLAHDMFGYKEDALIGKNVSTLMPPPYSTQHNSYLQRFARTQKPTILNSAQQLEGKHRLGHTFPITLTVTQVDSGGEVNFMGVLTLRAETGVHLSLTDRGVVKSVNAEFPKMFGYSEQEVVGRPFTDLLKVIDPRSFQKFIQAAMKAGKDKAEAERYFEARHLSGTIFPVSIKIGIDKSGGDKLGVLIKATVVSLADSLAVVTIDEVGNITSCNSFASTVFGYSNDALTSMNIAGLMPRPYSRFHASYLKRFREGGGGRVVGDNRGRMVSARHKDGRIFQIRLEVHEITEPGSDKRLFSGRITLNTSEAVDRRNAKIRVNTTTGLIEAASSTTEELFGRSPQVLVGKHISELVQLYSGNSAPEQVAAQLLALPPHTRSPDGDDTLDLKGVQEGPAPFVRAVITGAAREERLPLQVAVESEQAVSLQAKELVVWSCAQMEGVISITAAGIITGATLGAQALFGFRSYELIGTNVTVLMPVAIGRVHDLFLQRYQDMRMRKTVGTRRIVEGRHRDGSIIRIALEVSDAEKHQPGKPVFSARVVTTDEPLDPLPREVGEWQDTAEGAEEEEQEHEGAPEERATHGVMSDSATKEGATVAHAVHAAEETVDHARHSIAGFVQRAAHAAEEMLRPGHSHSHPAGPVTEAFDDAPRLGFDSQQSGGPGVLPRSLGSFDPRRGAAVFPVSDGPGEAGERAVAAQAWGAQAPVTPPQGGVDPRGGASLDSAFGQRGKPMSAAAAMMNAAALQSQSQPEQQGGSAQFRSSGFTEGASADVKASVQPASGNGPPHSWAQQRSVLSSAAPSGGNTNRGSGIVWGGDSSAGLQRQDSGGDGKPQDGQLMSRFAADSVQVVSADRTQWDNPSAGAIVAAQDTNAAQDRLAEAIPDEADHVVHDADFARHRRFKQIARLLNNPKMRRAVDALKSQLRVIWVVSLLCYVVSIIVIRIMGMQHATNVEGLIVMGELVIDLNRGAIDTRLIQWLSSGGTLSDEELEGTEERLHGFADDAEARSHTIYLGSEAAEPQKAVLDILNAEVLNLPRWKDVPVNGTGPPGFYQMQRMTGWDALQTYIGDLRSIAQKGQNRTLMNESAEFRFVIENGPTQIGPRIAIAAVEQAAIAKSFIKTMELAQLIILLGNGGVFFLSILYFQKLLHNMSQERITLFNLFLTIPLKAVIECGSRPIDIAEEDDNDEDTDWQVKVKAVEERLRRSKKEKEAAKSSAAQSGPDSDWNEPGQQSTKQNGDENGEEEAEDDKKSEVSGLTENPHFGASEMVQRAAEHLKFGQKGKSTRRVESDGAANYQAMAPLVLTAVAALIGFGVSYQLIFETEPSILTAAKAARTYALATRVRFFSTELVTLSNETRAEKAQGLRDRIHWAVSNATLNYYAAVYGVESEGTQQALTASVELDTLLFGQGFCLSPGGTQCYGEREPWYSSTAYGLDDIFHSWAEEATFLAMAKLQDATPANIHFMFVWEVGHNTFAGGLQRLLDLSNNLAEAKVEMALSLQIGLLVGSAVLNFAYFYFYFSPWLKRTLKESSRAAELLSLLPKELDIVGLIVKQFDAANDGDGKKPGGVGGAPAAPAASAVAKGRVM